MTDHNDLAARIERADGPDRAQFCAAYQLVFPPPADPFGEYADKMDAFCAQFDAGGFIDAAMQLVPEGWVIGQMAWWPCIRSATVHMDDKQKRTACSGAPSLPQALCAAALRAQVQP